MDEAEARRLLGVEPDSSEAAARSAHAEKAAPLRARAAAAPTDALRGKFERQIADLDAALALLAGGDTAGPERDLPSARPSARAAAPAAAPEPTAVPGETVAERAYARAETATAPDTGETVVRLRVRGADAATVQALAAAWRRLSKDDLDMTAAGDVLTFRAAGGDLLASHIERGRKVRRQAPFDATGAALADLARKLAETPPGLRLRELGGGMVWRTSTGELIPLGLAADAHDGDPARGADQAAIARLAIEILTNGAAADADELRQLRPGAPPALTRALERCLAAQRHDSLTALAEALDGKTGGLAVPAFLAERFPDLTPTHMLYGAGGLAAVVLLAVSYPVWKSAAPWQGLSDKQETARLSGVVKVMATRAERQAAEARQEAEAAGQEALRLQEKLEAVSAGGDYDEILPRYIEAGLKKTRAESVARDLAATESSLEAAQLKLAEAESLLASDDVKGALTRYRALETEYRRLTALPTALRDGLARKEAQQAMQLAGAWADKDCAGASRWSVADGVLSVDWPGQGRFRERLLGADGGQVFTMGETPESQAGRVFSYRLDGAELTASELGARPSRMTLKRC